MRILLTSDLHLEFTGAPLIGRLVAGMAEENPDAVVLAGDLGSPPQLFEECLALFQKLHCPVAVLPGNHDVWVMQGENSERILKEVLPAITRRMGFHWLEDGPMVLGDLAVAGNVGWYDYSAREPGLNQTDEDIIARKRHFAMDALRVNWRWNDPEFAALCRARLQKELDALEKDPAIHHVLVATHVPIFEVQIQRRPEDLNWSLGNPYFAHLTMGKLVEKYAKVKWVGSGHTHVGRGGNHERDGSAPIEAIVVGSDYGRPRWVRLET